MECGVEKCDVAKQLLIYNERLDTLNRRISRVWIAFAVIVAVIIIIAMMIYANSAYIPPPPPAQPSGDQAFE